MSKTHSDWLLSRAQSHPNHPALITERLTLNYNELARRAAGLVETLRERGMSPGDRVALLGSSSVEFVVAAHAVPMAGGVLVPLNARLTIEEVGWQLRNVEVSLLLCDGEMGPRAGDAAAIGAVPPPLLIRDSEADLPSDLHHGTGDIHSIIHTSGTTGSPKGALLTFGNFEASAAGSADNLGVSPGDRWIACMPLFHVGGLSILTRSAIYGTTVLLHSSFDAKRVNHALRHEGATLLSVVPTMLLRMLDADAEPFPDSIRAVLVGGGPVSEDGLRRALKRGLPVVQTYGLTESTSQVATLSPSDALSHVGSAGTALQSIEVRIDATEGGPGEILVRGPVVSPGYYGAAPVSDQWLRTGDIGELDEDGYLTVFDRRDDLIVSGGENIYPAEIEAVIASHQSVVEAALVGLPDAEWGHIPVAVIVPGSEFSAQELLEWLGARVAKYKLPKRVEVVDALPRTTSGKLQRGRVRASLLDTEKQGR